MTPEEQKEFQQTLKQIREYETKHLSWWKRLVNWIYRKAGMKEG